MCGLGYAQSCGRRLMHQMALSIVDVLLNRGTADQDALALSFGEHFDPIRGYGAAMHGLLPRAGERLMCESLGSR